MARFNLIDQEIQHFLYVDDLELIVYAMMILSIIILLYGTHTFIKRWTYNGQKIPVNDLGRRLKNLLTYGLLQRKVINHAYAGIMHTFIYVGMIGLFIATGLRAIDYHPILGSPVLVGQIYLWFKLGANIFGVMATLGAGMALFRRLTKGTSDLPNVLSDNLVLLGIIFVNVSGFLLDSIATFSYRLDWIGFYDPIGTSITFLFSSISPPDLITIYRVLWASHMIVVFVAIALIPYTKLSHILIGAFANTFYARAESPSLPQAIPNIYDIVENGKTLGVQKAVETTWKQRMDYDSCIKCTRCHNSCPANVSGKLLSPMDTMLKMRKLTIDGWEKPIWPDHIEAEAVWSCVLCGACVSECPLQIDQPETIMELRRGLFFEEKHVDREIKLISANILSKGNPYGFNSSEKEGWLNSLIESGLCEFAEKNSEYDYLYWIGCVTSLDPDLRKSSERLLKILKKAGMRVAILAEEQCCGDPSRRVGDELMFVEVLNMNKEIFQNYHFKKIVTGCPHCFNSLKNEYQQYNCALKVEHSTETLEHLINESKIIPENPVNLTVTYHDSCYLGRWNDIYDSPRNVLSAIPGVKLVEMERTRGNAFCCGGGGAQLFYEIKRGDRISKIRMAEAQKTSAEALIIACPYCSSMFKGEKTDLKLMDLTELLEKTIDYSK
jgi:Fe-S oxidoreductase/nitrate reductase gamma subunit